MSRLFPTFARMLRQTDQPAGLFPRWLSTPWWPADTLASQQQGLLQVLSVAISERLELVPLIKSWANEHRGRYRRRLFRLAKRLAAGTALPDALEQTPGALADEQMLAIRFGIQSGALSEVLRTSTKQPDRSLLAINHRLRQVGFYLAFMTVIFTLMITFIVIKITPSFQAIMNDFSMDITSPLQTLLSVTDTLVQLGPLIPLALLFCAWLVMSEFPRRFLRRRILSRILKPIVQLRSANLLTLLASAQQAGRPLPGTLSTLARYHYDTSLRHKLLFVRNEIEQGADLWASLAKTRLLSATESRALKSSDNTGATVWTLNHLAALKRSRVSRRVDRYAEFLLPIVVLLVASIVLLVALATITPLNALIEGMS